MSGTIYAAGALCWRVVDGAVRVLLIHRPKYSDITIPKGKVDPGESLPETAVREVDEETGLRVALGVPLGVAAYPLVGGKEKIVHYWAAEVSDKAASASRFAPTAEVSALEWMSVGQARAALTYPHDVEILDAFDALLGDGVSSTFAIIALRHAKAEPRHAWNGSDARRPLTAHGIRQAATDAPTLAAWRPKRIVTSTAARCVATVAPLAARTGIHPKQVYGISQDAYEDGESTVRDEVSKRIRKGRSAVLCSHGPVLPEILHEIALATGTVPGSYLSSAASLETGGFSVVHLSRSDPARGIITIETHAPRV